MANRPRMERRIESKTERMTQEKLIKSRVGLLELSDAICYAERVEESRLKRARQIKVWPLHTE